MEKNIILESGITSTDLMSMTLEEIIERFGEGRVKAGFIGKYKLSENSTNKRAQERQELKELRARARELEQKQIDSQRR